ncbi:methyl-accepting chemotaxis protein [Vibrio sp. SCSIO 43137]|uniref:methyl-accepting chemotaxis protein n=1 Tax=Vibrio sp. SCSIO 43137 TaxID=3021011 RepID=UPI002307E6B4|nr:methyl-accepting chemotaxis protein [Vibrio sp. SCSIO 43137]WCE32599.1 methyl-accepting chemotaxis protein [Vibrio sp. SCSIO 43137]
MLLVRRVLQLLGLRNIQSQLLLLIMVLFASGLIAMSIIYFGMQADATTINTAGKQRMLSQRVAKEALFIRSGYGNEAAVENSMDQFESAMQWLINGDKSREISAPATEEIKSQLDKVNQLWHLYRDDIRLLISHNQSGDFAQAGDVEKRVFERAPVVLKEMNKAVLMMEAQSNTDVKHNMLLSLLLITSLLFLSGCFYWYVSQFLMNPLLPLREALQKLSKGDLTFYLPADDREDEIGMLYRDYNGVLKDFSTILGNVVRSSEQLSVSSTQLKNAAAANAEGMDSQYREIEMISTAMNEISATIQEVASSSANASDYTDNAQSEATSGRETVKMATCTIDELNQQVQGVGESISILNENSLHISKVLDVINEIAEQTNLLALNAAIEAARAGESGRGFAVVADEVRGLAARTANSTQEIQQMVEKLQNQAKESVSAIQHSQQKAAVGVEHMHQADAALERIVEAVVAINEMNAHIATATKEESDVASDMNERIVHVAETSNTTRENAANNRQLAEHLSEVGTVLRDDTVRFTL